MVGPYGPGGYEIGFRIITPKIVYAIDFSPLVWGLGIGRTTIAVQLYILCFKITVQHTVWDTYGP